MNPTHSGKNPDEVLRGLAGDGKVSSPILVSRTGSLIAGTVPSGAHGETYAAMFAILCGAAETALTESGGTIRHVAIHGHGKAIVVLPVPDRGFLAAVAAEDAVGPAMAAMEHAAKEL